MVIGVHGAAVQLCVVENLGEDIDIAPIDVLNMEANRVLENTKEG